MKAATEYTCQHEREDDRHHPFLRCCIHEGSWANVYCFDDPMKSFGGKTGALVVKALSEQFQDLTKIERLRKEREMSAWLSTRCSAVKAPLGYCTDGVEDNMQLICFEWTPGINLREW
eukprot:6184773-Ditylum_brightwellii.AAC.1